MASLPRPIVWQLYAFGVCLLCLITLGVAGVSALLGSLRLHYPKLLLTGEQWEQAASLERFEASRDAAQAAADPVALRAAWEEHRRLLLRREAYLGQRQLIRSAAVMVVALGLFLPHWWVAHRFSRSEDGPPPVSHHR
jgi:hypothetical protein